MRRLCGPISAATAVCSMLLGTAFVMAVQGLALAGDGSYYLVRILGTDSVFGPDPRVLANAVRQAPLIAAMTAGTTDTHALTVVHGLGQLVIPAAVWCIAIVLARTDTAAFAAVAMTACLCAGGTWFFNVSESVLAVPLVVLVATLLWLPRPWRPSHAATAMAASTILMASYETAVLTGALFTVWAMWRRRVAAPRVERLSTVWVAAASATSVVVGAAGAQLDDGPTHAQSVLYFVLSLEPWPFYACLLGVAILVAGTALGGNGVVAFGALAIGTVIVAVGIAGLDFTTGSAFAARGGAALAGAFVSVFLFAAWIQRLPTAERAPRREARAWVLAVPVVIAAVFSATTLAASTTWARSLSAFRSGLDSQSGVMLAEDAVPDSGHSVLWRWTASSLSLVVRRTPEGAILIDRNPSYTPFEPTEARAQVPDEYVWRR